MPQPGANHMGGELFLEIRPAARPKVVENLRPWLNPRGSEDPFEGWPGILILAVVASGIFASDAKRPLLQRLELFDGIHSLRSNYYRILSQKFPFIIFYDLSDNRIEVIASLSCRMRPERIDSVISRR